MKANSHKVVTEKAFDLIKSQIPTFPGFLYAKKAAVAQKSPDTDEFNDMEFVDVEGGFGSGGRDNPHKDEWNAIDDKPHYSESGRNFTAFNHFIDIKKGSGAFDDFDGYSYKTGSASSGQYQDAADATSDFWPWLMGKITGKKVDEGINWWFNDEYVHAPGREWYQGCSPAVARYSYFQDKGIHGSIEAEAKKRFPLADSTGKTGKGIPYSVFMPVDNLARYWHSQYKKTLNPADLGPVMHAVQDASIPHHASGYMGNWHGRYEARIDQQVAGWFNDSNFATGVKQLFNSWNKNAPQPPTQLGANDWNKIPAKNWRIDMLVTWLALNAYRSYSQTYQNFKNGFNFNVADARELTKKATAMSMLTLSSAAEAIYAEDCVGFGYANAVVQKIANSWKIVDGNHWILDFGAKKPEADLALKIIKHYKMNAICFVGRPEASMTYFKCSGQAPVGPFTGEDAIPFNPAKLAVKKITINPFFWTWKIVENSHWLLDFGKAEHEAHIALMRIHKYGFNHICYVGRPNASMTYFRK